MASAMGLVQCEHYAGAIPLFEKARRIQPGSESVAYNLALAQYKQGVFAAAFKTLEPLAATQPDVVYLRGKIGEGLDAGLHLVRRERFAEAAVLLQAGLDRSPSSVRLLSSLGLAQFRLGRYRDAIRSYSRAIELEPGLDAAREGLAFLLYMTGDLDRARAVVEQGLKNPAADFYLSQLQAMILYRLSPQLRREALDAVGRALKGNPRFAPAYFLRGKLEMDAGRIEAALDDFRKAVELDPKFPLPYYRMAQLYLRQGRQREAEDARRRFSELGHLREEEALARQAQDLLMPGAR
jgi:tetratricopeptide (TPR) repeat protein